jgi:hypothetical protein
MIRTHSNSILKTALISMSLLLCPLAGRATLIAHWTFDSDVNSTVGSFTSTAGGDAAIDTGVTRVGGGSLHLDGAGDFVDIVGASELRGLANWTIAGFVRLDSINTGFSAIYTTDTYDAGDIHFNIAQSLVPDAVELARSGSTSMRYGNVEVETLSVWRHVAATWDGANGQLYFDGGPVGTGILDTANFASASLDGRIGSWAGDGGRDFEGNIDDLRIYDEVLSAGEIGALAAIPEPSTHVLLLFGLVSARLMAGRFMRS